MKTLLVSFLVLVHALSALAKDSEVWVYFGTYTREKDSEGIYVSKLNLDTGSLSKPTLAAEGDNPSFLTILPDSRRLVAVEETNDYEGKSSGSLASYIIDQSNGSLRLINRVPTDGGAPCHISADPSGRYVFFANYVGGSIGSASVSADGVLGLSSFSQHRGSSVLPRQKSPHAHSIDLDPSGKFIVCADLGLDKLMIYKYDSSNGKLAANDFAFAKVKLGNGPRHFVFSNDGKYGFTNNEITSSVAAFSFDSLSGKIRELQTLSTIPGEWAKKRNSTAELLMHPSGRFLYCSNRGHDSIAAYALDPVTGEMSLVEVQVLGVKTPRGFGIDPSGRYLIAGGQNSNDVRVFRINAKSGELSPVGPPVSVPCPVCVQFLVPSGGEFKSIFDGKSMKGWKGSDWFRVEDGAIVAGSLKKNVPKNQFLVTEKSYGDFDMKFKAKLVGQGKNAGVQFWSERIPNHHEMKGFQCDIGTMGKVSIWGALYDESRRGKFLDEVPLPTQKLTDINGWNQFRIRAEGNVITIWVNGALATKYYENGKESDIPRNGRFGLQIHSGPPAEAWYKDIEVLEL
ncbi:MAG TPA: DUF1080 domain-containing protein [Verrucomicrobia bacterium]|nr:DUF1080 domain-containing protein [Verrucomicrobiales bacterium]HIL54951.1 DUF1080 domain-containing protein [Verrucomicrobiota bacterium]